MKKMCRKVVSLLLAAVMVLTMTAFASVVYAADEDSVEADPNFKMGVILVGDETEGYSAAHIAGVKAAAKELKLLEKIKAYLEDGRLAKNFDDFEDADDYYEDHID